MIGEIRLRAGPASPVLSSFVADAGPQWHINTVTGVSGESLPMGRHLCIAEGEHLPASAGAWVLRGTTSNVRYTDRREADTLNAKQEGLGRPLAVRAAMIAIRKSAAWWALSQDERRAIFEEQSHHIRIGLDYLPGVARRLYHSRDLGEPFDFLTWFEYAPEDEEMFDDLLERLRATTEWRYIEREVDIRLSRCSAT